MIYALVGLALTLSGAVLRLYFLGRSFEKAKAALRDESRRARTYQSAHDDLKRRSEARINDIQKKHRQLFKEFMQTSGDDDRRAFLNRLLSEGSLPDGDGPVSD